MAQARKKNNFIQFALIFALVYLGSNLVMRTFFPNSFGNNTKAPGVYLSAANVREGNDAAIKIQNTTDTALILPNRCPNSPVDIFRVDTSGGADTLTPLTATGTAVPCEAVPPILPRTTATVSLTPWKYSILGQLGTYEVRLGKENASAFTGSGAMRTGSGATQSGAALAQGGPSVRFTVYEPGVLTKLFRTLITKPFLNFLIFNASWLPGHNLGLAIILLTVIVKLLLFIPTQKALQGQKEMQKLQPKVEALKKKYPDNPVKLQEETMKLWKEHKVNPMQSCLPTLIQFPVLIGLFYVIRDGSHLEVSRHLIYPAYQHLSWTFGTNFLGLNLLKPSWFILPPLLIVMQFFQMKLAFAISDRKKVKNDNIIDVPSVKEIQKEMKEASTDPVSAQKLQQNMMLYGLPVMIGVMAFQFPAAVAIYWGISTLFGIAQQLVVNRKSL
ncbi:MAG: preprotein translocase subunit YidC [Candidatus Peribacteria bacterium]|nr:preprotein translocase subunit YidC [Candidatus Peribacteria bacterium]